MDCAQRHGRYGHRDATMILVAYRHGLRASEVCDLQWQQIELSEGRLHVHRAKNGIPSVHPIRGDEMRALRKLRRDYPKDAHVFVSERGGPISPIGFHRLVQRLGEAAKMPFPIHPHMLRHACGFKLANDGHDTRSLQHYLGHRNIQHTVRYTELAPDRFKDFWRECDGGAGSIAPHGKILPFKEDDAPYRRDHSPGGGRTLRGLRARGPMPATATCHGQTL